MAEIKAAAPPTTMQRILDAVERVGNRVPHPVIIFVILIGIVIVLSHLFYMLGLSVSYQRINPETHEVEDVTTVARSLLTVDGIRFMFTGVVQNFMNFNAVGVIIVAMVGVGVAEEAGLIKALIRKLVIVAPGMGSTYILVFVGILSSIAADAGYLVLIPLGGAAFISVGRHPLAGLAAAFAGVAAAFLVNILIVPVDGILTEITNDAIHLVNPNDLDRPRRQPLVLDRLGDHADRRHRADHRAHGRAAPRPLHPGDYVLGDREHRCPPTRHRGLRGRRSSGCSASSRSSPPDAAAGRAAAQSRDRRDHRQLAVHDQPDRDHHADVPGLRRRLRHRRRHHEERQRRRHRDRPRRSPPGRPDLLFLVISQFIAYFNYTNMATLAGDLARRRAEGRQSRRCGC